jgi:hypothetical protein
MSGDVPNMPVKQGREGDAGEGRRQVPVTAGEEGEPVVA